MGACTAETLCAVMMDHYIVLEAQNKAHEDNLKKEAMICTESLQIPGPLGAIQIFSQGFKAYEPKESPKRVPRLEVTKKVKKMMPIKQKRSLLKGLPDMNPYLVIVDDLGQDDKYHLEGVADKVRKWIKYEYFYSGIDKSYFERNDLQEIIEALKIPYKKMRRADYILIRKSIGKRRRLSQRFLNEERQRLHNYREIARETAPYVVKKSVKID
jgi:hypothetical protein